MTWKRIATAVVLIPGGVALILKGSTVVVALALALVILLALFEFFALGDAIGHRAHKFWTAACALGIVYVQWLQVVWHVEPTFSKFNAEAVTSHAVVTAAMGAVFLLVFLWRRGALKNEFPYEPAASVEGHH